MQTRVRMMNTLAPPKNKNPRTSMLTVGSCVVDGESFEIKELAFYKCTGFLKFSDISGDIPQLNKDDINTHIRQ